MQPHVPLQTGTELAGHPVHSTAETQLHPLPPLDVELVADEALSDEVLTDEVPADEVDVAIAPPPECDELVSDDEGPVPPAPPCPVVPSVQLPSFVLH